MAEPGTSMSDQPGFDDLSWAELYFICYFVGDPVELLRPLAHPRKTPRLPATFGPMKRPATVKRHLALNTDLSGTSLTIAIHPPDHWRFGERAKVPSVLLEPQDVWLVTLDLDWRLFPAHDTVPPAAGPLDVLAALCESDAAIVIGDEPDRQHVVRPGWLAPHLELDSTLDLYVPIKPDVDGPRGNAALFESDPRLGRVVATSDVERFVFLSEAGPYAKTVPDGLDALETRLREALL